MRAHTPSTQSEEWKKSAQQQSEAVQRQIEKAQASAQENLATQTSLQMDLDNKTKLLQLAKRAQEDAEKEVPRPLLVSISILNLNPGPRTLNPEP